MHSSVRSISFKTNSIKRVTRSNKVPVRNYTTTEAPKYGIGILPLSVEAYKANEIFMKESAKLTRDKLYVSLHIPNVQYERQYAKLEDVLDDFYYIVHKVGMSGKRPMMDCRILVPHLGGNVTAVLHSPELEVVYNGKVHFHEEFLNKERTSRGMKAVEFLPIDTGLKKETNLREKRSKEPKIPFRTFPSVAVAGVFDHLHNGHRRFLSLAAFRAKERFVVAMPIAPGEKQYPELLQSVEVRKAAVESFLSTVKPQKVKVEVHTFPRSEDVEKCCMVDDSVKVDCIVCEDDPDSNAGSQKVNEAREKKGLPVVPIINVKKPKIRINATEIRAWLHKHKNDKK